MLDWPTIANFKLRHAYFARKLHSTSLWKQSCLKWWSKQPKRANCFFLSVTQLTLDGHWVPPSACVYCSQTHSLHPLEQERVGRVIAQLIIKHNKISPQKLNCEGNSTGGSITDMNFAEFGCLALRSDSERFKNEWFSGSDCASNSSLHFVREAMSSSLISGWVPSNFLSVAAISCTVFLTKDLY